MRNILWYYYQIRCEDISQEKNGYLIKRGDETFLFKKIEVLNDDLKKIMEILYFNQIQTHQIMININGEIVTKYDNKSFVLLKIIDFNRIGYIDFANLDVKLETNDIGTLWSKKIDYYMQQLREFGVNKDMLINSFNYYVGMAENAIAISNRINNNEIKFKYTIQHKRLTYPLNSLEYYDPTLLIIDIKTRDISEYCKSKFFNDKMTINELSTLISKYDFNDYEMNMLYARLLFPTYYFDLFEDMIIDADDEKKIIEILSKRKEYESFLNQFFEVYKNKYSIFEIEWLKKEPLKALDQ